MTQVAPILLQAVRAHLEAPTGGPDSGPGAGTGGVAAGAPGQGGGDGDGPAPPLPLQEACACLSAAFEKTAAAQALGPPFLDLTPAMAAPGGASAPPASAGAELFSLLGQVMAAPLPWAARLAAASAGAVACERASALRKQGSPGPDPAGTPAAGLDVWATWGVSLLPGLVACLEDVHVQQVGVWHCCSDGCRTACWDFLLGVAPRLADSCWWLSV